MQGLLHGWCPICGEPAPGAGGTKCWRCQKRIQRGQDPAAELVGPRNGLREAAIRYADADAVDDLAYQRADTALVAAAETVCLARGWRPPRRPRFSVRPAPRPLPLLEWAGVMAAPLPQARAHAALTE